MASRSMTAWGGGQLGYAPLTTLLYRSVSYSPWLASIIVRRILSCSRRFLSTCRLVRRKRMMPDGNPMALQNSQQSRRWRMERMGRETRVLCHAGAAWTVPCSAPQSPVPPTEQRSLPEPTLSTPEPLTRPPPPASSGSCPSCVWGCTPPPRGAPGWQAPDWPLVLLAGGSSAQGAECPGGPAVPRPWQDTRKILLPRAVLWGENL